MTKLKESRQSKGLTIRALSELSIRILPRNTVISHDRVLKSFIDNMEKLEKERVKRSDATYKSRLERMINELRCEMSDIVE